METIYRDARRTELRKRLARHKQRVSVRTIVKRVNGNPHLFDEVKISVSSVYRFLDLKKGWVSDGCLTALEHYLEIAREFESAPSAPKPAKRVTRSGGLFAEVQEFYDMRSETADELSGAVLGTYAFFAYSEWSCEHVCRGAIEFTVAKNGDFEVKEIQRGTPFGAAVPHDELFSGHFILGADMLIAMLRDGQKKRPKFYILSVHPYRRNNDKKNNVMDGALLKIGAKSAVFIGNVRMVRRATALEECDVIPRSGIDQEIIDYLDSDIWAARDMGLRNSTEQLWRLALGSGNVRGRSGDGSAEA